MQYVFVADSNELNNIDTTLSIAGVTDSYLYSLFPALNKQSSGILTVSKTGWNINHSNEIFSKHSTLIDSGGYSVLTGAVPPEKIKTALQCYIHYAKCGIEDYDNLFSFDVPCSLKFDEMNTEQAIYEANLDSLERTIDLCREMPEISKKLFFVWHFKMRPQYYIWKDLHNSLDIPKFFHNYAIGGLVGIRGKAKINYSAFTGMAYGCLLEFLRGNYADRRFRLHVLGVYLPCDRLQMALLEKIFRRYIQDEDRPALFSYDSVNPKRSALLNAKAPFLDMSDEGLFTVYRTLTEVPLECHRKVYTEGGFQKIFLELERKINGQRLENPKSFVPLYVYSFGVMDRLLESLIEEDELDKLIFECSSFTTVKRKVENILSKYAEKYPYIFTKYRCESILKNTERLHWWHKWFQGYYPGYDYDKMMEREIADINFDKIMTLRS